MQGKKVTCEIKRRNCLFFLHFLLSGEKGLPYKFNAFSMVSILFAFNNSDCLVSQGTREEDDVVSEDLVEQDAQVSVNIRILDLELAIKYDLFQTDLWINYTTNQYYVDSDCSIVALCGQMFVYSKCINLQTLSSHMKKIKLK